MNRIMLSRYITKLGYQAMLVENGRQALEKLHGEPFDLVLLDVEMPEMDGYQVLEQLKVISPPVIQARLADKAFDSGGVGQQWFDWCLAWYETV